MKTRLVITIGIIAGILTIIAVFAVITPSIEAKHHQDCIYDGGKVTGFLKCTRTNMDYSIDTPTVTINLGATNPNNKHSITPKEISVELGTNNTVTWINLDGQMHFINFEDWAIGPLEQGDKQSITFNQTGIYKYFSADTPSISGSVIVKDLTMSKISECYALFDCDSTKQNFEKCVNSYQYGFTVKSICQFSNVTVNGGCLNIKFEDGTGMITCD